MAADFTRPDFNLAARVAQLTDNLTSPDVTIDKRTVRGFVSKVGQHRKNWKKRWFVFDLDGHSVRYFESDKAKNDKGGFNTDDVVRVFAPPPSAEIKERYLFIVEVCFLRGGGGGKREKKKKK